MKKPLLFSIMTVLVLSATLSLSGTSTIHAYKKTIATCYGYSPCKACSNCSQCKHCTNGGSCGVCTRPVLKKSSTPKSTSSTGTQCRATTRKGTRCSRRATSNGYCWQHD